MNYLQLAPAPAHVKLSYRQLQAKLKEYRAQGHKVPKLNSKKSVLEAALKEIESEIETASEVKRLEKEMDAFVESSPYHRYGIDTVEWEYRIALLKGMVQSA